jgi:prophage antirepressor-like protein
MANNIVLFQFQDEEIRFVGDRPVANDVARVLGYKDPADAVYRLVKEKNKSVCKTQTLDGKLRDITVLEEPGIYQLIFSSKLPSAEKFQDWVFEEVLPSIRKTGEYGQRQELSETEKLKIELENAKIELEIAKLRLETTKTDVERERFALDSKQPSESISQFSSIPTASAYNSNSANAIQRAKLIDAIAEYMDKYERDHKRIPDIRILHQRFQRWVLITDDGKPIRINSAILRNLIPEVNTYRTAR